MWMELFIRIPDEILTSMLVDWVEIEDVCRLDTAACNFTWRKCLFSAVYSHLRYLRNDSIFNHSQTKRLDKSIMWSVKRGFGVTAITLTNESKHDGPLMAALHRLGSSISTVRFGSQSNWSHDIAEIAACCPNVSAIYVQSNMDDVAFQLMGERWQNLRQISIVGASDAMLDAIAEHLVTLESIELCALGCNSTGVMRLLELRGPRLRRFSCELNSGSGSSGIEQSIARFCPQLKSLKLRGPFDYAGVVREAVAHCRHLIELNICEAVLTDASCATIAQLGTVLQSLKFDSLTPGSEASMVDLLRRCPNLRSLWVNVLSASGEVWEPVVVTVGQQCPNMLELTMPVTDTGLIFLAVGCPQLVHLACTFSTITDEGLIALLRNCPRLCVLYVSRCEGVTDASLLVLPQLCPHVRELSILGCNYTSAGLRAVAQGCRKLRHWFVNDEDREDAKRLVEESGVFRPGLVI